MRKTILCAPILIGCLAASCKTTGQQGSRLKHVENEMIRNHLGTWQWAGMEREQFIRVVYGVDLSSEKADSRRQLIYPESTKTSQFINYWIDAIHKRLTNSIPGKWPKFLRRKASSWPMKLPNAFVSGVKLCFPDIEIDLSESGVNLRPGVQQMTNLP